LACPQPKLVVDHTTSLTRYSGTGVKVSCPHECRDCRARPDSVACPAPARTGRAGAPQQSPGLPRP
jgi:hypothetical protein